MIASGGTLDSTNRSAWLSLTDDQNARAQERLNTESVAWLTTVAPDGTPQTAVVSSFWDGDTILFYSKPDTWRLRNLATNRRVSFHLCCDDPGNQMVAIEGDARVDRAAPKSKDLPAYLAKYEEPYERWNMDGEDTADQYRVAVRVQTTRIRT